MPQHQSDVQQINYNIIILLMQGFKGLIQRPALTNESFQMVIKKAEDYRLSSQLLTQFFIQIIRFEQKRVMVNDKLLKQHFTQEFKDNFNSYLWNTFSKLMNQQRLIFENTKNSVQQTTKLNNKVFSSISMEVTKLQQALQLYKQCEQSIAEKSKKYYKNHKSMLTAIDFYKTSFSDVNLIYNMDQKTKRYQNCQILYKTVKDQFKIINDQCQLLLQKKKNVSNAYNNLLVQFQKGIKEVSQNSIQKAKQFMFYLCFTMNNIIQIFKKYQQNAQKIVLIQIFKDQFTAQKLEYFEDSKSIDVNKSIPIIIQYHKLLKQDYLKIFNTEVPAYLKLVEERLKYKKSENKKMFELINIYFKNIQKILSPGVKQILIHFQKNKKKISDCFGNRLLTFLKAINSIFQTSVGVNQKTDEEINPIMKSIESILNQESKLVKYFGQQVNSNIERFYIKRFMKQGEESMQQKQVSVRLIRKQIEQKAEFIKHLITGFQQKMDKIYIRLINTFNELVYTFGKYMNQYLSFCNEYYDLYFGDIQFPKNMEKYLEDFNKIRLKNKQAYTQLLLNTVSNQVGKIVFQGEINKIEDFKKLKKPLPSSLNTPDLKSQLSSVRDANQQQRSVSGNDLKKVQLAKSNSNLNEQDNKQTNKNIEFLKTKINFKQNEKYVKSFNCALAQKIILHGKIYITTQRVAFYSKFNSNNIFFGKTFIQFPKTDIKKIQKRQNSLMLDNSISFTTVNGEIFFTYFFSRDLAYDLICKTFNFSLDDHVYEYEQNQVNDIPQFLIENQQKDDIKLNQVQKRKQEIEKMIPQFPFSEAAKIQIIEEGLNALKLFKIFFHQNEINFNGKKYPNFILYFKELINHKDLQITQWNPPLSQVLNQSNIKQNAPKCNKRTVKATIPISSTGVPFMPKTAVSQQFQNLYFLSKHKFVIQSSIQTKGAPYTDTFKVQLRTTVESNEDGKCQILVEYYVNFVKSTMMRSVIQSKSKQETISGTSYQLNEIKRYFEILRSKPKKTQSKSIQELSIDLEIASRQLNQSKQQNTKIVQKLAIASKKQKTMKYLLIGSVVLNIMLILFTII